MIRMKYVGREPGDRCIEKAVLGEDKDIDLSVVKGSTTLDGKKKI